MNTNTPIINLVLLCMLLSGCSSNRPGGAGQYNGKFASCPNKPNCVNSEASDARHHIASFKLKSATDRVWPALENAIKNYQEETAIIIVTSKDHIYAEFTTPLMKYVDDVEFHLHAEQQIIALRSASRVGYGDIGANRNRIEKIREILQKQGLVE